MKLEHLYLTLSQKDINAFLPSHSHIAISLEDPGLIVTYGKIKAFIESIEVKKDLATIILYKRPRMIGFPIPLSLASLFLPKEIQASYPYLKISLKRWKKDYGTVEKAVFWVEGKALHLTLEKLHLSNNLIMLLSNFTHSSRERT